MTTKDTGGSAWQPIETAPKDGARVLLFSYASTWSGGKDLSQPIIRCGHCEAGVYSRMVPVEGTNYFRNEAYEAIRWLSDDTYLTDSRVLEPTHWMPLPAPPLAARKEES